MKTRITNPEAVSLWILMRDNATEFWRLSTASPSKYFISYVNSSAVAKAKMKKKKKMFDIFEND